MSYGTLEQPKDRPSNVPKQAQWLGGVGAGAYFHILATDQPGAYTVSRWDEDGHLDCERIMDLETTVALDLNQNYVFTYPAHCAEVNIIQGTQQFQLLWEGNNVF